MQKPRSFLLLGLICALTASAISLGQQNDINAAHINQRRTLILCNLAALFASDENLIRATGRAAANAVLSPFLAHPLTQALVQTAVSALINAAQSHAQARPREQVYYYNSNSGNPYELPLPCAPYTPLIKIGGYSLSTVPLHPNVYGSTVSPEYCTPYEFYQRTAGDIVNNRPAPEEYVFAKVRDLAWLLVNFHRFLPQEVSRDIYNTVLKLNNNPRWLAFIQQQHSFYPVSRVCDVQAEKQALTAQYEAEQRRRNAEDAARERVRIKQQAVQRQAQCVPASAPKAPPATCVNVPEQPMKTCGSSTPTIQKPLLCDAGKTEKLFEELSQYPEWKDACIGIGVSSELGKIMPTIALCAKAIKHNPGRATFNC